MASPEPRVVRAFPGGRGFHITPEVWGLISRHLSLKEWAHVAGVCQAAWRVQYANERCVVYDVPVEGLSQHGWSLGSEIAACGIATGAATKAIIVRCHLLADQCYA